ncbi:DNA primase, small subunit [Xylona heveae TC161]|uniref:DNA primase n=1 Tax=Xylona heveae (strain CBS 132557 / TC161) TaxID=1328760 RepID=A0A165G8W3_XYLHT|nr:DNA primase, small subunit [Xylona heveae TC161]KZF21884.1 DNA primase, small subunit [Xylona heveae TC161]
MSIYSSLPAPKYSDPEIMYAFYQRLFPFRTLFQWLNHSPTPSNDFGHREFAFTLQNDAYLRYQAFPTADLLRKEVLRLNPSRFEIGPVYTTNPRERKTLRKASAFRPLAKELVFDIDLTDYDEIRTCCDKANICHKCWSFVTMAIKVVDAALKDDFGFKHIMWVYSGRRGAHAWVCDRRAREMDDQKRKAIAGYLELIRGGAQTSKKVNIRRPLHPHIARSLDILKAHFQTDILTDQDPWQSDERFATLLKLLPDKSLNESLRKKWESSPNRPSTSKWADIDSLAKTGASRSLDRKALLEAKQDIVLEYTYPRLDVEVSKKLIHLLKSPFVVHPGTGRVCVPIDTRRLEEFDPLGVPTVTQLLDEIDEWDRREGAVGGGNGSQGNGSQGNGNDDPANSQERRLQDYEKTSLKPYVDYFRAFVASLLKDEKVLKRERNEGGADAMEF